MRNSYLEKLEAEFEPLNQAIEEIELYLKVEVIPVGGLHRKIKKTSETPKTTSRNALQPLFMGVRRISALKKWVNSSQKILGL